MDYRRIYSKKYDKHLMKVVVSEHEYDEIISGLDSLINKGDPDAIKLKKIIDMTTAEYIPYTDEEKETMKGLYKCFVMFEDNLYTIGIIGFYYLALQRKNENLINMLYEEVINLNK